MVRGSCLCGDVTFEYEAPASPFQFCHCRRCRKASGSLFAGYTVRGLEFLTGADRIGSYEAPILHAPPAYRRDFCTRCGSPLPWPTGEADVYALPAGALDEDPGLRPERHVWVNQQAPWLQFNDDLARFTDAQFLLHWLREWEEAHGECPVAGYEFILCPTGNARCRRLTIV